MQVFRHVSNLVFQHFSVCHVVLTLMHLLDRNALWQLKGGFKGNFLKGV